MKVKKFLIAVLNEMLEPFRERRKYYEGRIGEVYEILRAGSEAAREVAAENARRRETRHEDRLLRRQGADRKSGRTFRTQGIKPQRNKTTTDLNLRADHIYRTFLRLTRRLSNSQIMMLLAVVVGVLAGVGTYLFEMLLYGIKYGLTNWFPVDSSHILFLIYPAVGIILATLFVKYIVRDNISEGVTRVLYAMSSRNSRIAGHNCWTSIVGGATTIGFGGSVGPEAPIVLTGAAIGSNVGRIARLNYKHTTLLLCCGAGAALAAIFKAPITGVVFVLEILMLDITAGSVIPLLIASITATTMAFMLRGFDPILAVTLAPADAFELWQIPLFILLGVCCGLMSWYFTSTNLRVSTLFKKIDKQYKKWIVGGTVLGVLIFIFPPLYGEGYEGFTSLMHGQAEKLFDNSLFYRFSDIDWVVILFVIATMFFKVIAMASTNAAGAWAEHSPRRCSWAHSRARR